MNDIVSYNNFLQNSMASSCNIDVFEKLIITELSTPICDYHNAIELIRNNFSRCMSYKLLVIGAYIVSEWSTDENEFLIILKAIEKHLDLDNRSLVWWLDAHHLQFRCKDYLNSKEYYTSLCKSIEYSQKGVFNMIAYAQLQSNTIGFSAQDIINNISHVYCYDEIMSMPVEQKANIDDYISEHIMGTKLSYSVYEHVIKKVNDICKV